MELANEKILSKYPLKLRRNIRELWINPIGISSLNPRICLNPKKLRHDFDVLKANSLIIEIPYAGKQLNWEVIFNDEDLSLAPDFEFCNDLFLIDPDIEIIKNAVPSLLRWDMDNPKSLITIIKEFLKLYHQLQLLRLKENKFLRQYTEYLKLLKDGVISDEDVEIYIDNNDIVHLLIAINLDFSNLPPYLQVEYFNNNTILNPGSDTASIRVCLGSPSPATKTMPTLTLSPRLQQLLGPSNQLHIPLYEREGGLAQYVPKVSKLLKDKLHYISKQYKFRKDFISFILAYQGVSLVEYDNITFSCITLLLQSDNAYALVTINLTKTFPHERPLVKLTSISYETDGKPLMVMPPIPYNNKSSMESIVKTLLKYLIEAIPTFKLI